MPSEGKPGGVEEGVSLEGSAEVWELRVNVFGKGRALWSVGFNLFPLWTPRKGWDLVFT